jgi:eukaryotic-like serine/threonine-protein kinase
LIHGTKTRITFNPAQNIQPSWSPDGQRIVFSELSGSRISAGSTIHARPANGGRQDEVLVGPENNTVPVTFSWPQWSSDGKYLVYSKASGPSGGSIWALQTSGENKPFPVVQPQGQQGTIQFSRLSPDSKWLAYTSTESGREELYITSFPRANGRWQISQNGGTAPAWRGDSKELYFYEFSAGQTQIMAVDVAAQGDQFETRNYHKLFALGHVIAGGNANFEVTPDGHRFLIPVQPEVAAAPISLTLNWRGKLGK